MLCALSPSHPIPRVEQVKGQRFYIHRPPSLPPACRHGTAVALRLQYTLSGGSLSSLPAVLWRCVNVRGFLIRLRSQTGPKAEAAPLCLKLPLSLPLSIPSFLLPLFNSFSGCLRESLTPCSPLLFLFLLSAHQASVLLRGQRRLRL